MEDKDLKIKITIEGYEEFKELKAEIEALSFIAEGFDKALDRIIGNADKMKKIASNDDEAK